MIAGIALAAVLLLVGLMLRGPGGRPLAPPERFYLVTAPLPIVLALVLPSALGWLATGPAARSWGLRLTAVGGWSSAALVLSGVVLIWRRRSRGLGSDRRLAAGLLLASLPAVLMAMIAVLYRL